MFTCQDPKERNGGRGHTESELSGHRCGMKSRAPAPHCLELTMGGTAGREAQNPSGLQSFPTRDENYSHVSSPKMHKTTTLCITFQGVMAPKTLNLTERSSEHTWTQVQTLGYESETLPSPRFSTAVMLTWPGHHRLSGGFNCEQNISHPHFTFLCCIYSG